MTLSRRSWIAFGAVATFWTALIVAGWVALPGFIGTVHRQEAHPLLNSLIQDPGLHPLDFYLKKGRLALGVAALFFPAMIAGAAFVWTRRRRIAEGFRGFFEAESHPFNLAVFRIVIFAVLLDKALLPNVLWYISLPHELQVPPDALGWVLPLLPATDIAVCAAWAAFTLACCFGMIGFLTRLSSLVAAVLGFYLMGLTQLYGKVDHYHFLIWFLLLFTAGHAGDFFGVDAVLAARRRADRGDIEPPGPSVAYGLSLRFAWLLIGVVYFFPGLWKIITCGPEWGLGDNLKYHLHEKWLETGVVPAFRIDRYPLLYRLSGVGTLAFEISFVFLLFIPGLRMLAVFGGLAFHNLTNAFMQIPFYPLQFSYVCFFDWKKIAERVGRRYGQAWVGYDGGCGICRRTIASLRVFDIFGRTSYVNVLDAAAVAASGLRSVPADALVRDMHVIIEGRTFRGFLAYRALAWRLPLFWPALPFLHLWPVPLVGEAVYRRVADSRACRFLHRPATPVVAGPRRMSARAVTLLGAALLGVNLIYGFLQIGSGWPFACFPTFAWFQGPVIDVIAVRLVHADGSAREIGKEGLSEGWRPHKFRGLIVRTLEVTDDADRKRRLEAFWRHIVSRAPELRSVRRVEFYRDSVQSAPEKWGLPPVKRRLLYTLEVPEGGR